MKQNENYQQIKIGMVSLGCNKNQVDAEIMLSKLKNAGFTICDNEEDCDVIIVNTCGFIESAKTESIENILEICSLKEDGKLRLCVVTGCLAERYADQIKELIPEADVILGLGKNKDIVEMIKKALDGEKICQQGVKEELELEGSRLLANPPYYAYLKIAEGCDNFCTYCAIPSIRGRFRSRKAENILVEARELAENGVKELIVIAQDTSRYGEDIYGKSMLPSLLRELCKTPGIEWIRLLYCYPDRITDELLDVMASEDKIVKYLDMPLQHSSGRILKLMNRFGNDESLRELCNKIRAKVPGICLRTTMLVGFPSETDEDVSGLCQFIKDMKFERLGCFSFSAEEGTAAIKLPDQIDEEIGMERAELIMREQMNVSSSLAQGLVGKTLKILTEGYDEENDIYFGRSYMDAPDIDTKTFFTSSNKLSQGDFAMVKITQTDGYDLLGEDIGGEL